MDDKTYPYIFIDYGEDFSNDLKSRKIKKVKISNILGPYSTGAADMLDSIYEIVPLVQKILCKSKPNCLFYQIQNAM